MFCNTFQYLSDIASTSLQHRQSISLTSFLQYPHLHQSTFPILISDKSRLLKPWKRDCVFFLSHGFHYFFTFQNQTEMVEDKLSESLHYHLHFPQNSRFHS